MKITWNIKNSLKNFKPDFCPPLGTVHVVYIGKQSTPLLGVAQLMTGI